MAYNLIWESPKVTARFTGFVTAEEFLEGARRVNEDYRFDGLRFIINDFCEIAGHDISLDGVGERIAVKSIGGVVVNPKVQVLIVTTDPVLIELDRVLHGPAMGCPYVSHVFPDRRSVARWLREQAAVA